MMGSTEKHPYIQSTLKTLELESKNSNLPWRFWWEWVWGSGYQVLNVLAVEPNISTERNVIL